MRVRGSPSAEREVEVFRLDALQERFDVLRLPYTLRILLENVLRNEDGVTVTAADVEAVAGWVAAAEPSQAISFTPGRVLHQDFTGVPAIVDLAAMRNAMSDLGGDAARINPQLPSELVIDHSVQVDEFATPFAIGRNSELEFQRNRERYAFLRWGQGVGGSSTSRSSRPRRGSCTRSNLEFLARVVDERDGTAFPDTLLGNRLAHDDDQRARRARLGRRRDRGRGGHARRGRLDARSAGRRLQALGRAVRRARRRPISS